MKSIISLLSSLVLITACNSDSEEKKTETIPTTEQKLPKCFIEEGTPKTESSVVVYVHCTEGNTRINEATLTLNNQVKSLEYKDFAINDYVGFGNLEASKNYRAELEVVVGGEVIKKSVKIETKAEITSTPTPIINTSPIWTKKVYFKEIDEKYFDNGNTLMELAKISYDKEDTIDYNIVNVDISKYNLLIPQCIPVPYPFRPEKGFYIDLDKLKAYFNEFESCRYGIITVTIRAKAKGGFSDAKIEVAFLANTQPPSGDK